MADKTKEAHRRMGLSAIRMARDTGRSPIDLSEQSSVHSRDSPRWITVWFLKQANQMSVEQLSRSLALPHNSVSQMLSQLEHARSTQPWVNEWMTQLVRDQFISDTTMGEEARSPALSSFREV